MLLLFQIWRPCEGRDDVWPSILTLFGLGRTYLKMAVKHWFVGDSCDTVVRDTVVCDTAVCDALVCDTLVCDTVVCDGL